MSLHKVRFSVTIYTEQAKAWDKALEVGATTGKHFPCVEEVTATAIITSCEEGCYHVPLDFTIDAVSYEAALVEAEVVRLWMRSELDVDSMIILKKIQGR